MRESFSSRLMQFAFAVDIVNDEVLDEVLRLVGEYVKEGLHMEVCVLFIRHQVGREPGLMSIWNSAGYSWSHALKDRDGNYNGQVSFAFASRKALWIVSDDYEPLEDTAAAYCDCLRNAETSEIPKYLPAADYPVKTSVYLPILVASFDRESRFASRSPDVMGILNFESAERIECTPALEAEVVAISEAVSRIYRMWEAHSVQSRGTTMANRALEKALHHSIEELKRKPLIGKHGLFVATASESSDDVVGAIRDVVNGYGQSIRPYYWKQDARAGNIHAQLWDEIRRCQCGIFYLSQLASGDDQHVYTDNPNVLFEAGMMYSLLGGDPTRSALVLVREKDSPGVPFDILAERRIIVPRDCDDEFNEESFRAKLTAQLDQVIQQSLQ